MSTDPRLPEFGAVFSRLNALYAGAGMRLLGGFSPYVSSGDAARSTFVARDRTVLSTSAGIAVDEMAFAYGLCERVAPRRILVIGNSYGVSTVFFALANPDATVIAIDKYRTVGIAVTNQLLASERAEGGPVARAIQASTPDDLEGVIKEHLDDSVDLVFVDAVHENDVQSAEFRVLEPLLSPGEQSSSTTSSRALSRRRSNNSGRNSLGSTSRCARGRRPEWRSRSGVLAFGCGTTWISGLRDPRTSPASMISCGCGGGRRERRTTVMFRHRSHSHRIRSSDGSGPRCWVIWGRSARACWLA